MSMRHASSAIHLDPVELRRQLALRGLRQDELAKLSGLTPSTISKAARIGGPLSAVSVRRLARALGAIPPDPLTATLLAPAPPRPAAVDDGTPRGPHALGVQATSTPDADGHPPR